MVKTELWPEEVTEDGETITTGVTITRTDGTRSHLWYRLPSACRKDLTPSCDPFLLGSLFGAMRTSSQMRVHGEVSPSLLIGLEEFQTVWSCWKPEVYRRIDITADTERETEKAQPSTAVMAFSGGVDSSFTAWRHRTGNLGRQQWDLRAGVFIQGFDIPLADEEAYRSAAHKASRMLSSLGLEPIEVATNFRDLKDNWIDAHGAGLASCLTLLKARFQTGLIASSYPYSNLLFPYGSNPLTDGMFSSASFRIVHDGAGFTRLEKIRGIRPWPEALKYLRVCWEGELKDRNCCRCQKCVSNMLYFRILDRELPECFESDISNQEIIRLNYPEADMIASMERLIRVAQEGQVADSWVRALERSVAINRRRLNPGALGRLRRFFR